MLRGEVEGYFLLGQNPAVGSANGRMHRLAMMNLKWLVVRDLNMIESATFWKDGPEILNGERSPENIETEVFFLPAAAYAEKSGSFTQTQRLLQWRHQAVAPPGEADSELDCFYRLGLRLRALLADPDDPRDRPLLDLTWDYGPGRAATAQVDPEKVLAEINGSYLTGDRAGEALESFTQMRADGTTAGGCWIYTGVYAGGVNQAARRTPASDDDPLALEWGWAWPGNRRVLYNRASADPAGRPWSERKKHIWWNESAGAWEGRDMPDFVADLPPTARPEPGARGVAALAGDDPFTMQRDGKGWLFAPVGLLDGPLPTHYEPIESPVPNALYPQQHNPTVVTLTDEENLQAPEPGDPGGEVYPYAFTTYRLTEHHTAGGMSRWLGYLSELQPEMFCEVSPELADERGLEHAGWATIVSARAAIEARVLVTDRVKPLQVGGRTVHQIGLPYHWGVGSDAIVTGDAANDLIGVTMDPNVLIQASKAGTCDIRPGRRPRGHALRDLVEEYQRRSGASAAPPEGPHLAHENPERRACWDSPSDRPTPPLTRGGPGAIPGKGSSPTPPSASGARRVRSRARSGTNSPPIPMGCSAPRTTTAAGSARTRGATSPSSSRTPIGSPRPASPGARWSTLGCRRCRLTRQPRRAAGEWTSFPIPTRTTTLAAPPPNCARPTPRSSAGSCPPTCASTAPTPAASTCAPPGRWSARHAAPRSSDATCRP